MKIECAAKFLRALLAERHESLALELKAAYPARQIESFAHQLCDEMYCLGIRAEWQDTKPRCVALQANLIAANGSEGTRGFVEWDGTYRAGDGNRYICHDGATTCYYGFGEENLRRLAADTVLLEKTYRDALARGTPLVPSPIEGRK